MASAPTVTLQVRLNSYFCTFTSWLLIHVFHSCCPFSFSCAVSLPPILINSSSLPISLIAVPYSPLSLSLCHFFFLLSLNYLCLSLAIILMPVFHLHSPFLFPSVSLAVSLTLSPHHPSLSFLPVNQLLVLFSFVLLVYHLLFAVCVCPYCVSPLPFLVEHSHNTCSCSQRNNF